MLKKKNILLLSILILFMTLFCADADASMLNTVADKGVKIFRKVKGIIYIFAGFGLIGIAYQAIFGKLKWNWLSGLSVGIAVLAAVGAVADYALPASAGSYGSTGGEGTITLFKTLSSKTVTFAKGLQEVAFVLGGFGVVMFTFLAICGKINFKHLGYIMICLFFLSGTGLMISYLTGGKANSSLGELKRFAEPTSFTTTGAGDTFRQAGTGSMSNF